MPTNPLRNRVGLILLVVTLLVCAIFARLGLWQLNRAAEKSTMMEQANSAAATAVSTQLDNIDLQRDTYRRFRLDGQYEQGRQFLLDNRIHDGRAGFEVLAMFRLDGDDGYVLVNRGWIAGGATRSEKPAVALAEARASVSTLLTQPSTGFALGPALQEGDSEWPRLLQFVDYNAITSASGLPLKFSAVFVAEANQPGALEYNFQPVANGPEKHYAYAFQWFAMLLALVVIYVYLVFIKRNDTR